MCLLGENWRRGGNWTGHRWGPKSQTSKPEYEYENAVIWRGHAYDVRISVKTPKILDYKFAHIEARALILDAFFANGIIYPLKNS